MIRTLKTHLRSILGVKAETDFYSQCGEDAIISKLFGYVLSVDKGYYVDIGAYHPFKHSNTYLLYKAGWRGMNIDPRPGSKTLFDRYRPQDINIEAGIAEVEGILTYYVVGEESTMNSFSRENLERLGMFKDVVRTVDVPVHTLNSILSGHPEITAIDYLNIDAEGYEKEIISGLDVCPLKPTVISIEQNGIFTLADVLASETCDLMSSNGYSAVAKNIILREVATVFYVRNERL